MSYIRIYFHRHGQTPCNSKLENHFEETQNLFKGQYLATILQSNQIEYLMENNCYFQN